ncbi:AMP-binding protein [Agrobacterium salinitolerans]|uniref:AMP-binding protein n=1 Tax=Agrobacterium salinitolerans TaxID=1183413 RepID=UPI0022B83A0F|nr:AMP-binding protein [Agrobacterium salinitolerans]MCZ7888935.1 AMP-binding protein [Agrobacterium salinitolerans]
MTTIFGPRRASRFGSSNILQVFSEVVSAHYSNDAILGAHERFTFEELASRVEGLSHELRRAGVGAGQAVILQLPPGPEFITAALSVMSLSAVFTPISVDEPRERANRMCANVGATHILTLNAGDTARFRSLEVAQLKGSGSLYPDNTAYILHTSGTTGMPKGAILPVGALTNCLDWHIDLLKFSSGDRISHLSRPTFDFSVPELFLPIVTGGAMVIPSRSIGENLSVAVDQLAGHDTTIFQMVPTILSRFLRYAEAAPHITKRLRSLRHMVCNGEALTDPLRRTFYRLFPDASLHNCYGPTEACVAVTSYTCPKEDRALPMYLGAPAPNVVLHFVREDGEPAVNGDIAELWIGGAQNSIGYAKNPEQTRERFRELIVGDAKMSFYRTGDWVSLDDERLLFAGRRDGQVKYKGVRIELGEIQKVIERSGFCSGAKVLLSENNGTKNKVTGQVLSCFVTPENVDIEAVKRYAEQNLPADRRPDVFVSIVQFPATPNGKLDTRELLLQLERKETSDGHSINSSPADTSRSEKLDCILECLKEAAGRRIDPLEKGVDIGLDSLSLMELHIGLARRGLEMHGNTPVLDDMSVAEWVDYLKPISTDDAAIHPKGPGEVAKMFDKLQEFFLHIESLTPEIVVLHTSLADFKGFGTRDVLDHFLDKITSLSRRCTVAVPSFTPSFTRTGTYHYINSKSETGALATELQKKLGALRSRHPVYSFTLLGPRAREYAERDWWRYEPFGRGSLFEDLSRHRSLIAMIGTYSLAHPHRCEHRVSAPYFYNRIVSGNMIFEDARVQASTRVYARDFDGSEEEFLLAQDVPVTLDIIEDQLQRMSLGPTHAATIWVEDLEQALVAALRADPFRLLQRDRAHHLRAWSENPS